MLRVHDDFGFPSRGGTLALQSDTKAVHVFTEGRQRTVVDADANGRPEEVEDLLPEGTRIFAYDWNQDGRPEVLGSEAAMHLVLRGAWSFMQLGDRDRNGTFDAMETHTPEGPNTLRIRHYVDEQQSGDFIEVRSSLTPAMLR